MQSRKVRQCSVECSAGAKLSVDHFFHSITRDNGDVQHRKKNLVFPGSAIEHQDGIAGAKDVSKSRLVYSVGTAINLQMDRMDLLVAQRDRGIGLGRRAGADIATQSSYANQNYFNKGIRFSPYMIA